MTSLALIYPAQVNEIPAQKRGLTGPSYTTQVGERVDTLR